MESWRGEETCRDYMDGRQQACILNLDILMDKPTLNPCNLRDRKDHARIAYTHYYD